MKKTQPLHVFVRSCGALAALVAPFAPQSSSREAVVQGDVPTASQQCIVVGVATDEEPGSMVDGPLAIVTVFNGNVTVAQQAVAEWTAIVENVGQIANPYSISFVNGPLGGNSLALANTVFNISSGVILRSKITIDNDGSSTFFVDPTPAQNEEFSAGLRLHHGGLLEHRPPQRDASRDRTRARLGGSLRDPSE